jgi:hypothetical protein
MKNARSAIVFGQKSRHSSGFSKSMVCMIELSTFFQIKTELEQLILGSVFEKDKSVTDILEGTHHLIHLFPVRLTFLTCHRTVPSGAVLGVSSCHMFVFVRS